MTSPCKEFRETFYVKGRNKKIVKLENIFTDLLKAFVIVVELMIVCEKDPVIVC